jgi:hypothetical protein
MVNEQELKMPTFSCTYQELKQVAGDYIKAIPGATLEELDAGLKCVQLHYLGLKEDTPEHEIAGAAALLRIVSKEFMKAEIVLAPWPN